MQFGQLISQLIIYYFIFIIRQVIRNTLWGWHALPTKIREDRFYIMFFFIWQIPFTTGNYQ